MKNVTGYDLPRLMVGSLGTLGVLAQVTLRCRPARRSRSGSRASEPPTHVYRPAAMLWNEVGVFVRCEGDATDVDAQGRGSTKREAPDTARRRAPRPHLRRAGVRSPRSSPTSLAVSAGGGARRRHGPRRRRLRRRRWQRARDAAARARRLDAPRSRRRRHRPVRPGAPDRELMYRIETAFDPTGKLAPGRLPSYEAARSRRRRARRLRACGLCLPHCPTYRVTGVEIASPRGRIAAMRAVDQRGAAIDDTFLRAMDECVQCRGCEAACPRACSSAI